jgi:cell shape-determining protein MreC
MNYLSRNRSRISRQKIYLVTFLFIAGALFLSYFDKVVVAAISPIWKSENAITKSIKNSFSYFRTKSSLINENGELKNRVLTLEDQTQLLANLQTREAELLALLGRTRDRNGVTAGVLVRSPQIPYDTIIIDAGSGEGVKADAKVVLPEGAAIGSVFEIFAHTSKVKLYSTSGEKTNAILERDSVPVILLGEGGGNFRLILPRDARVETGDRVLSADMSGRLLAVVKEIALKPTDPFKEVLLGAPESIFGTRFVEVLP